MRYKTALNNGFLMLFTQRENPVNTKVLDQVLLYIEHFQEQQHERQTATSIATAHNLNHRHLLSP